MTRHVAKWLCSIVLLSLMFSSAPGVQSPNVRKTDKDSVESNTGNDPVRQVQAVFDLYIQGWKRGDVDALSHIYANNTRVTGIWPDPTQSYPVQGWPAVRAELVKVMEFTKGMDMHYSPRHVELYGDVAIISTNWEWRDIEHPSDPGRPNIHEAAKAVYIRGQGTFVFLRHDGQWRLVHEHASVLPEIANLATGK